MGLKRAQAGRPGRLWCRPVPLTRTAVLPSCPADQDGSVLTSGFIDGIANTLGTSIDMETPDLQYSSGEAVAERTLSHVRKDSLSIVLDSTIDVADEDAEFKVRVFLVPGPGSFVNLLDHLRVEEITDRKVSAGELP
jgi:chemotaxis protein CheC